MTLPDGKKNLVVCPDLEALSRKVAGEFVALADRSVATQGRFAVALSGGATPEGLYSLLAAPEFCPQIPWPRVHLFWGDERCVPPDHPESNYRMIYECLLSKAPIPKENVYRLEGEKEPQTAAADYERELRRFFGLAAGGLPRFDLILLGLGGDGHTASLFPGSEALRERQRLVAAVYVEKLKTHRLTLTLPVLNNGANIFFLVAGEDKAEVLRRVLAGKKEPEHYPAQGVRAEKGELVWLVDRAAAALLEKQ